MNAARPQRRLKVLAAILGGSAVVALGGLTMAGHQGPTVSGDTSYVSRSRTTMTLGGEVTTTDAEPMHLATEKAVPLVTATFNGKH